MRRGGSTGGTRGFLIVQRIVRVAFVRMCLSRAVNPRFVFCAVGKETAQLVLGVVKPLAYGSVCRAESIQPDIPLMRVQVKAAGWVVVRARAVNAMSLKTAAWEHAARTQIVVELRVYGVKQVMVSGPCVAYPI